MRLTNEEIEKKGHEFYPDVEGESWAGSRAVFKTGAMFARNYSPKLKTLNEWGWVRNRVVHVGSEHSIHFSYKLESGYVFFRSSWRGIEWLNVGVYEDVEHGKKVAQLDYDNKINEFCV